MSKGFLKYQEKLLHMHHQYFLFYLHLISQTQKGLDAFTYITLDIFII